MKTAKPNSWWHSVNRRSLRADLFAGLTGAVIVLPQGVAFAMLAGLPPEYGLYTAIVPVIIAAMFGSSHHLMSGPTTPISVVVLTTVSAFALPETPTYISLVLTLTFMVGLFQFLMGLARLGMLVNFISHSVVIGFTTGAALLIITAQMKNALGLEFARDLSFWSNWGQIVQQFSDLNPYALSITIATLVTALIIQYFRPNWPSLFLAMICGSLLASLLGGTARDIELIGSLPNQLPPLSTPNLNLDTIGQLASGALAIALLGLVEAISIARSIAAQSHQAHDANREFVGQGLSNLAGSFFSSYASSGSFTRSGVNYRAGAQTPLAAVFSAVAVVLILLFAAPLAAYLPIPAMAAVLMLVAFRLIDWRQIKVILKANPVDAAVLITTFISTLFVELTFAIYVGVMLSLVLHLNRISYPTIHSLLPDENSVERRFVPTTLDAECPQLKIIRIDGSLFFGSSNYIERSLRDISDNMPEQKHLLIIASGINFIDVAGAEFLIREAKRRREKGGALYLCAVKEGVSQILRKGGYIKQFGDKHIFETKEVAIHSIYQALDQQHCQKCRIQAFIECPENTNKNQG